MARVTIQDCLEKIENPFTLVKAASNRARVLAMGCTSLLPADNHKPTVTALREIAEGLLDDTGKIKAAYQTQQEGDKNDEVEEAIEAEIEESRMEDEGHIEPPDGDAKAVNDNDESSDT